MKSEKYYVVTIFSALIIGYLIWHKINVKYLLREGRYTVGTIVDVRPTARVGYSVSFRFKVQGKTYEFVTGLYEYKRGLIGQRYYVAFSPKNPKNCIFLWDKKVPEKIGDPPPEGWAKIPKVPWNNWPVVVGKRPSKSGHAKQDTSSSGRDVR